MSDLSLQTYLRALFNDRARVHLDIVDDQIDFMKRDGALSVNPPHGLESAEEIIEPTNQFLAALPEGSLADVLVKFDTHIADEYRQSEEGKVFPPHCIWGTKGWELAIQLSSLPDRLPTFMMAKNVFDMWGGVSTGVDAKQIRFNIGEKQVHDNLYRAIRLKAGVDPAQQLATATPAEGVEREAFMAARNIGGGSVVMVMGVASDWCTRYAIEGYLKRGATVLVLEDLTRGIGGAPSVAPNTGSSAEVADKYFTSYQKSGQLRLVQSRDVLAVLHPEG